MKPDTNTNTNTNKSSGGGGGMSRAAKKRAKKNKKKMDIEGDHHQQDIPKKKVKLDLGDEAQDSKVKAKFDDVDSETLKKSVGLATGLPSFENADVLELLLLKESIDEERKKQLQSLPSEQRAACVFQAILDPIPLADFYKEYWEKKPLLVRAKNKQRFEGLLSLERIKDISSSSPLFYGRDLNVTKYTKDETGAKRRLTLDKLPRTPEEE